jgi:hypothetical protein
MSISLLKDKPPPYHLPVHDLHSFFFVFIWICIAYETPGKRHRNLPKPLRGWLGVDANLLKTGQFGLESSFREEILSKFSPYFTDLADFAHRLWTILNPAELIDYTEQEADNLRLHCEVLALFDEELGRLQGSGLEHDQIITAESAPIPQPIEPIILRRSPRNIEGTNAKIRALMMK